MDENVKESIEMTRELGKSCFFNSDGDEEKRKLGLELLLEAVKKKDPEASFLIGRLILGGKLTTSDKDPADRAVSLVCFAANHGYMRARTFLNLYCEARYHAEVGKNFPPQEGPLTDFEGKPIKIDRRGVFTPVDAVLKYENGKNVLTLSTTLDFCYLDSDMENKEILEQAVIDGIMDWEGEYEVFGGQKLTVRILLSLDSNMFDHITVLPVTENLIDAMHSVNKVLVTEKQKERAEILIDKKRSFAFLGFKWSVNSRKTIFLKSKSGRFDDYDEMKHVAKHEFGHALGLGDLYESMVDSLPGVSRGTYAELDGYAVGHKDYNLVMCDHNGPISNNDIEMVVLAFSENEMQLYQPEQVKGRISTALGKGN
ncbi:MAG: hypothetical protein IKJ74_04995 [Clostridia bacterium]|nr:hypothetical protein [Clostridia bacterium]